MLLFYASSRATIQSRHSIGNTLRQSRIAQARQQFHCLQLLASTQTSGESVFLRLVSVSLVSFSNAYLRFEFAAKRSKKITQQDCHFSGHQREVEVEKFFLVLGLLFVLLLQDVEEANALEAQ